MSSTAIAFSAVAICVAVAPVEYTSGVPAIAGWIVVYTAIVVDDVADAADSWLSFNAVTVMLYGVPSPGSHFDASPSRTGVGASNFTAGCGESFNGVNVNLYPQIPGVVDGGTDTRTVCKDGCVTVAVAGPAGG